MRKRLIFAAAMTVTLSLSSPWLYAETDFAQIKQDAQRGNAAAQYNLGVMYNQGLGVRQDYTLARQWYEKAASQGHAKAQVNLGMMYEGGLGVRQDLGAAKEWYGKACDGGLQKGCEAYAKLNRAGH